MAWLLCRTTPLPIATFSRSLSSLGSLSSASRLCAARPAARLGVLRVAAGHAADAYDPRHSSSKHAQQSAPFASYTGRGKPTRTRTRVQEETPAEQSTRYSEIAKRHDESVAQSQRHSETAATERQADSLHDAGLKNFMVNVYTTTGGCIGMAAVGSVLPILGVVPMVHPLIPGLGMIVRARPCRWCSPHPQCHPARRTAVSQRANTQARLRPHISGLWCVCVCAFNARQGMYFYLMWYTDSSTNPTKRTALIGAFAGMTGMTLAPAILVYSSIDPIIVPTAFALSCLTFAGATGGALMAPKGSMLKYGPVLGGAICCLIGLQLVGVRATTLDTSRCFAHCAVFTLPALLGRNETAPLLDCNGALPASVHSFARVHVSACLGGADFHASPDLSQHFAVWGIAALHRIHRIRYAGRYLELRGGRSRPRLAQLKFLRQLRCDLPAYDGGTELSRNPFPRCLPPPSA